MEKLICDFCREAIEIEEDRRLIQGRFACICDKCIMEALNILEVAKEMENEEVEQRRSTFKLVETE